MTMGIINVLKPPGMTSHDVVSFIRRLYSIKRVGHSGTLDPAAAGVLPVFLGSATRLIEYTAFDEKTYRVELTFGYSTDTGDDTGVVITQDPSGRHLPSQEKITEILHSFIGSIKQIPPMHSAIKINGKRLYQLARQGISIEREPRVVDIKNIELIRIALPTVLFDVTCSKGTYVRSLCADIGEKTGCPAVMSFLVRTRVGNFIIADAITLEEIAAGKENAVLPPDYAINYIPAVFLNDQEIKAFRNGQTIQFSTQVPNSKFRVYLAQGDFVGIGNNSSGLTRLTPVKILN